MALRNAFEELALDTTVQEASDRLAIVAKEAQLSDLLSRVGPAAGDSLLSILRSIAANTATEVTRADTLELTAEQVQLNTDTLESLLTSLLNSTATDAKLETIRALLATAGGFPVAVAAGGSIGQPVPSRGLQVGGVDPGGVLRALRVAADGTQQVVAIPVADQVAVQDLLVVGDTLELPVRDGDKSFSIRFVSGAGTILFEQQLKGSTTWDAIYMGRTDGSSAMATSTNGPAAQSWAMRLQGGVAKVRARLSVLTTAPVTIRIATSASADGPVQAYLSSATSITAGLTSASAMIGYTRAHGAWFDDTSTPLAASGIFTGTARDIAGVASGAVWNATTVTSVDGAVEMRGLAISDVTGTLALEVSRDNVNWRRVFSKAMSNADTDVVGAGGLIYKAEIAYKPATRYARWVFTNGAGAQTHFTLQTVLLAA